MTETSVKKAIGIDGFALKIIALVTMTVDHVGAAFFPSVTVLRIIGRLSWPIFAFLLAEGSRYTRNPLRRIATIAGLGAVCELAYDIFTGGWYGNILLSLAISATLLYLLRTAKAAALSETPDYKRSAIYFAAFAAAVAAAFCFAFFVGVDYGFCGIMTPVLAGLFDFRGMKIPAALSDFDCHATRIFGLTVGLVLVSVTSVFSVQPWCLFAVPLIALYNGRKGRWGLKYFFYAYYPCHLLLIELVQIILLQAAM